MLTLTHFHAIALNRRDIYFEDGETLAIVIFHNNEHISNRLQQSIYIAGNNDRCRYSPKKQIAQRPAGNIVQSAFSESDALIE